MRKRSEHARQDSIRDILVNSPEQAGRACGCNRHEGNVTCEFARVYPAKVEPSVWIIYQGRGNERYPNEGLIDETLREQVVGDCGDGTGVRDGPLCQVARSDAENAVKALLKKRFVNMLVSETREHLPLKPYDSDATPIDWPRIVADPSVTSSVT